MQRAHGFANEGQQIAGTLHLPNGVGPHPGVLLCHGFTGMRLEAHFLFVKMSRALERAGFASLRFDFRGSGESEGEFREMTVETEVSDALKAVDVFCEVPEVDGGRIGVIGLSLGGPPADGAPHPSPSAPPGRSPRCGPRSCGARGRNSGTPWPTPGGEGAPR